MTTQPVAKDRTPDQRVYRDRARLRALRAIAARHYDEYSASRPRPATGAQRLAARQLIARRYPDEYRQLYVDQLRAIRGIGPLPAHERARGVSAALV